MSAATAEAPRRPWRTPALGVAAGADGLRVCGGPEGGQRWDDWCAGHAGARVRLWLGSTLWLALPADGLGRWAGDAALRARAAELLRATQGEAAAAWPLAPWRSPAGQGVLALSDPQLQDAAAAHRVQIAAMRPACWPALAARLRADRALRNAPHALLVLDEAGASTVMALQAGRLAALLVRHRLPGPAAAGQATPDAEDALADCRAALGLPPDAPAWRSPLWPDANSAGGQWPLRGAPGMPDLADSGRPGAVAWTAAVAAGLALAAAGWEASGEHQALADAEARVAAAQADRRAAESSWQATASARSGGDNPSPTPPPADEPAAAALARPWGERLGAVEAATPPRVRWTALDLDAGRLRLEGQAATPADALAAARALGLQAPWRDAVLTRLAPAAGGTRQDFALEAREATR